MNWARQAIASRTAVERCRRRGIAVMEVLCDHPYPGTREGLILVLELPPIELDGPAAEPNGEHRRSELADFLRRRRESLQPEDVGLPGGGRRRTPGLRR